MIDPILNIFREEAREHLRSLEAGFLELESTKDPIRRQDQIHAMFRHAHSLKGDARVIGLDDLQHVAQLLENILDRFRENPLAADRPAIDNGLANLDRLRQLFEIWHDQTFGRAPQVSREAKLLPTGETPHASELRAASPSQPQDRDSSFSSENFTVRVPAERLDRMLNLVGELRIAQRSGNAVSGQLFDLRQYLEQTMRDAPPELRAEMEGAFDQVLRIEAEVRKQHNRERLLMQSLDEDIRQARLLPIGMLAESLRRAVRDLGQKLDKPLRYEVEVGKILLDKAVIEALQAPLTHLIRNAADHGVEPIAVRKAKGKPEEGCIRLQARQRGDMVRIAVSDDGAGLNYARIRASLISRGNFTPAQASELSEQELASYLFQPGFTTSELGEVSGRGVGLDAVRNAAQRLHGRIELGESSTDGTTFILTVPLTVSTIRVLTVWSSGQCFGIPSAMIVQSGRARRADLRDLEGVTVVSVDGEPVRWVALVDLLGVDTAHRPATTLAVPYLLIAHGERRVAVAVDDLEDEREVLLKPLGFPLTGMPGVLGGTIRPDGSVQLVLDLTSDAFSPAQSRRGIPHAEPRPGRVLVVDDSPTTRAVLRNLLTRAGYSVRTAVDGLDALEKLRTHPVDLVVSDFEMPRLNGVDLTRQIKIRFGLPVILVTARERDQHRQEGLEAGADAYVVKSKFQGEGLLDIVRQFV